MHALRRIQLLVATAAVCLLAPTTANALTVTSQSAPSCDTHSALTDWTRTLQVPQFNPETGTLTGVAVTQSVNVKSEYKVESKNGAARTDTLTLNGANVTMTVPGFAATTAALPSATARTFTFTTYDGAVDYAGTSGATGSFGVAEGGGTQLASSIASWIGGSYVAIPATSAASTASTLSGNFALIWDTTSEAKVCVTYTYTNEVLVCIGDYVWYDNNKDGIQNSDEAGVPGRVVRVTDANGVQIGITRTDENGRWKVCNLEPSTACVATVGLPFRYGVTTLFAGSDRGLDSDGVASGINATIACLTPATGEDLTFDVGIYKSAAILPSRPSSAAAPTPNLLRMSKVANRTTISSGASVKFFVRVANPSNEALFNVRVCDVPPRQLAFANRPRGASLSGGQLCWNVSRLPAKSTRVFSYVMRATNVAARSCVMNRATATAPGASASARDDVCVRPTPTALLQLAG